MVLDVILVIYNTVLAQSETYASLLNASSDLEHLYIKVYDNGPFPQKVSYVDSVNISYVHDPSNGGLAKAYNYALSNTSDKSSWLLLLDQDSRLPSDFISTLIETIDKLDDDLVVALVPHIVCENRIASPCKVHFGGRLEGITQRFTGACESELMAINSGMAVRTSFLKKIGGFNQEFWLDFLDHWLCRTIYAEGKKIYVMPSTLDHNLSVSNYNQVSEDRARNILNAEVLFYRKYKPESERFVYFFRLLARSMKQLIMLKNKSIAGYTLKTALTFHGR